jgi:hypothetical protein
MSGVSAQNHVTTAGPCGPGLARHESRDCDASHQRIRIVDPGIHALLAPRQ